MKRWHVTCLVVECFVFVAVVLMVIDCVRMISAE